MFCPLRICTESVMARDRCHFPSTPRWVKKFRNRGGLSYDRPPRQCLRK
jgi:hypothetical protein